MQMTDAAQFRELYNEQRVNQGLAPYDYTKWNANTDWQNEIFQRGFLTNNNVKFLGASEKNRFYLGIGYTSEQGNIKHEKYSKATVNLSSDYNVTDFLRFGFQVNASRTLPSDAKGVSAAIKAAPISPVYNSQRGELLHTLPDFQRAQVWNPLIDVKTRANTALGVNNRAAGNIYGEVDFLKKLPSSKQRSR